jgi:diguanylate cyclase (GGDEF)-like protein
MVLLPVVWIAMYGERWALWSSLVATGAVFIGPWLLVGGTDYPAAELRRGVILMLVAGLVGVTVQALVRSLEGQRAAVTATARQAAAAAEQLAAVAHVRHSLLVNKDPRSAICRGARDLTGASMSVLLEPTDDRSLVARASVGADLSGTTVALDPARSAAVECLLTGQRIFIPDTRSDPRVPQLLREQVSAASLFYEPVVRRGQVVAVLMVGWSFTVDLAAETRAAMSLMAVEASVALEQADLLQTVHDLARTDQLTGGPNRRAFDEMLPGVLQDASGAAPACVALLDLDHFKRYNDAHGHPAGDRLLQRATATWTRQLKGTDVLARYGGEEFVVVLRDCLLENALVVLDKLRDATPDDQTVSIGIAQWDGQESQQALIQRADEALYRAKSAGRNRLYCAV